MIIDQIKHLNRYTFMMKSGNPVEHFLNSADIATLGTEKVHIPESDCKAVYQAYKTQLVEMCRWENHRENIDIQYILKGTECIRWTSVDNLESDGGYQSEKDAEYYKNGLFGDVITLSAGWFAMLFPGEGHMAKIALDEPEAVTKIVIKVPIKDFSINSKHKDHA